VSLSRQLALASHDEFQEAMAVFAKKTLIEGGKRREFEAKVRPLLRAMHRGGMDKQRLSCLQRLAHQEFTKARIQGSNDVVIADRS
jgi:hypothetical protein